MKVAFGLKAHSGWAVLVVVGSSSFEIQIVDRRRIDLVNNAWAKQPYHAAEHLPRAEACELVKRGIEQANRIAIDQLSAAIARARELKHHVAGCAVLVPNPMPNWSTDEILSVHFRMHKAEGVLFPEALCYAANACGLDVVAIPEQHLHDHAASGLSIPTQDLMATIAKLGKAIGPPWGADQKAAALAAMVALHVRCNDAVN